jgi:enoyl-CoA hydratase/carnithine racemase
VEGAHLPQTQDNDFAAELVAQIDGPIATITLNRPEIGNSLTRPMMIRLAKHIEDLGARPVVGVLVLAAEGAEFCRGRDGRGESRAGMSPYEVRAHLLSGLLSVFDAIAKAPIPLVSCVQGPASNFGVTLAAACDITLASDRATFRYAEIEQGTPPTTALSILMPNVAAKALAYLIYGARAFPAQQALRCGLVADVFPHDRFAEETRAFIATLAGRPRIALESIKRFQGRAAALSPDMRSEYAIALRALAGS